MSEQPTTAQCPSCGRFVGPYETCPYCGADVGQRISIRAFKYGSLALAILGVAVLLYAAIRSETPTVEVGDLVGTMNWAYVRLEGTVIRQPTYDPETRSLKLWLWDGTGEIMVTAYRSEADWLVENDRLPAMGDAVALEGTLRVKDDFQYLILNVPQHTEIWPAEPLALEIGQVDAGLLYQPVTVRGVVREERLPYEGLRILTLRDATGEIDVTLPTSATLWGGDLPDLRVGQSVQVSGAVDQYKGTPQISVGRGRDVVLLAEEIAIALARSIGNLSAAEVGRLVQVEGQIVKVSPFSAGVKFTLDDGTGTVTLLLWQDVYDSLAEHSALVEGATVRAVGEVSEYRGELEIVPELPADVALLAVAERTVTERQLGELSAADVGQMVQVEGVLKSLRSFSAGAKGALDDGTGTVTLLLWQDVYDGLAEPEALTPGAVLRVVGEVSEYRGELEVAPQVAADVAVVGAVELPLEEIAIGQLASADVGQMVQVAGQISQVMLFTKGVKFTLDDGTGTLTLLIWQDLYDQSDLFSTLAEGFWVRVRGEVAEYQGELEIVPQVPADVEVTRGGPIAQVTPTPTPFVMPTAEATLSPTATPSPTPTVPPTAPPEPTATLTPAVETRTIGQVGWDDREQQFTIQQATINEVGFTSAGVAYTISDGTGSITLWIYQDTYEEMDRQLRYEMVPGSVVKVTGEIGEYEGNLQIKPRDKNDVELISSGQNFPLETRAIADITPSDAGQRWFIVEATIQEAQTFSFGTKLVVSDGTGQIIVFLWPNIYERVPEQARLTPGTRIRVFGQFVIYEKTNELEIIPQAGTDVKVLP